jgi:hypothetical protein
LRIRRLRAKKERHEREAEKIEREGGWRRWRPLAGEEGCGAVTIWDSFIEHERGSKLVGNQASSPYNVIYYLSDIESRFGIGQGPLEESG